VFSLDKKSVTEEGVAFSYELDGKKTFLSPERSMQIQMTLGSDIAMAFDECLPAEAPEATVAASVEMTTRWAERCIAAHDKPDQSLFGIVQGGMFPQMRRRSVAEITALPFDGFAIGGLSVGEGPEKMNEMLAATMPHMPPHLPRYLMGVGRPQDLVDGVALGVDMFDCVIPTRHARGGALYTFQGRIRVTHSRYRRDTYPIDTACGCYTCQRFSRAYLHHLFSIGEVLGTTLATIHNLRFFSDLMAKIRETIREGSFASFRKDIKALYPEKTTDTGLDGDDTHDATRARKKVARKKMADAAFSDEAPAAGARARKGRGQRGSARAGAKGAGGGKRGPAPRPGKPTKKRGGR
jgi:queuine tRNA-ribosyltransferase